MASNRNIGTLLNNFGFIDPFVKARHAGFLPEDTSGNIMWADNLTRLDKPEAEENDQVDNWDDQDGIVATA